MASAPASTRDHPKHGRERLMRYGARPQLALDRLRRLPGGRIAYRIKKLRAGRAKHRVMTPLEFLARPSLPFLIVPRLVLEPEFLPPGSPPQKSKP